MNTRASFQEVTKDVSLKRGSWNGEGTYFYTLFWCKWTNRVFAVVIVIAYIVWNYQLMQWLTFPQHTPGGDKKKKITWDYPWFLASKLRNGSEWATLFPN